MELIVLGSGTGQPTRDRGPAGYVVRTPRDIVLFDFGPGSMYRLTRAGVDYAPIATLFLTHHHADHCADVVALIFANLWAVEARQQRPLRIVGPRGTRQLIDTLLTVFPGLRPSAWEPQVEEWERGETSGEDWRVTSVPVVHASVAALAFRIESEGRSLVYSGDTGECEAMVEIARGADVLLIECSFPDGRQTTSHLTPGSAGRIARRAGVKQVVLTHFYPEFEGIDPRRQCAQEYRGRIRLARDYMRLTI